MMRGIFVAAMFAQVIDFSGAATLRIMSMGDALTEGSKKVPGAYRTMLNQELSDLGYTTEFVGNGKSGGIQHEGHKTFNIVTMTEYVDEFLDASDPDIILLMIGSKDVQGEEDFKTAFERYDRLIHKVASARPFSHIFAANLPPRKNSDENALIQEYFNPHIPTIVSSHQSAGRKVTFVDVNAAININDLSTNLHPSDHGYNLIGSAFASSISSVVSPNLSGLKRGILRVEGSLDRHHLQITFTKPLPRTKKVITNFIISKNVVIYDSSFVDDERRVVELSTSEQMIGERYKIRVVKGLQVRKNSFFTTGWRMLLLADWHLGEKYVFQENPDQIANDIEIIKFLKENYEGEVLMIPGDTNAGFWHTEEFQSKMNEFIGQSLEDEAVVLEGGNRCYSGLLSSFRFGGYSNVLAAIGDHELGDNAWEKSSLKSKLQPEFRQAFATNFNHNYDGYFKYTEHIGIENPNPIGTKFEETSFAYVHRNTLIVTVDVLNQFHYDVDIGSLGTVTGEVTDGHLQWLDNVLSEGSKLPEVRHIIIQGHFPTIYPVRKTKSSGIYMDNNENSEFWQVLRKHPVDIYFAGEAHLNTVSQDPQSGIIQIVSRGNFFSNFLSIDITDDSIVITSYDEVGTEKTMKNFNYETSGQLRITKVGGSKNTIASGELALFDSDDPILYFNFESKQNLEDRPVLGLGELPGVRRSPTVASVDIFGKDCSEALINVGVFGQDYDAQSGNVELASGLYGQGGIFTVDSRAAVFGMGPHSGSHAISYTMWFKTTSYGNRILLAYEGFWVRDTVLTLRLRSGTAEVVYSQSQKLVVQGHDSLNDGIWHHIATTMPSDGCKFSEIEVFIDGLKAETTLIGGDNTIDLPNGGMMSLGGFGYGGIGNQNSSQRQGFLMGLNFEGILDEIMVFARSLSTNEILEKSSVPKTFTLRSKVSYVLNEALCLGFDLFGNSVVLRVCTDAVAQQWIQDTLGYIHNKDKYEKCLVPENGTGGLKVKLQDCNVGVSSYFSWTLDYSSVLHVDTGTLLTVNANNNNGVEISEEDKNLPPGQAWDILYEGGFPPSYLTGIPSLAPTTTPTGIPSVSPSRKPSSNPTSSPSSEPSASPSVLPTFEPTSMPSLLPTATPSGKPTDSPSNAPSDIPTTDPTALPSFFPTDTPTVWPSSSPTAASSSSPSQIPSVSAGPSLGCEDKEGIIIVANGKEKTCINAIRFPKQCERFEALRNHCRQTCGLCNSIFSISPTKAPSVAQSPTQSPTKHPTQSPTQSPDKVPVPTRSPTDSQTESPVAVQVPTPVPTKSPVAVQVPTPVPTKSPVEVQVPTPVPTLCIDNDKSFQLLSGRTITCDNPLKNPNLCKKNIVERNCPVSCNFCCRDSTKEFELLSGRKITCTNPLNNPNLCKKNIVKRNCPLTCEECVVSLSGGNCVDKPGKVQLSNGMKRGCGYVRGNEKRCIKHSELRNHCPKSCDECDDS